MPDTQLVEAKEIDWAWEQLLTTNKDGIRYCIDIKKSLENIDFLPSKWTHYLFKKEQSKK